MTDLSHELEAALEDERRRAIRALLRTPLNVDPDVFVLVRRHRDALAAWFQSELGYRLVVDSDFARLHKMPAPVPLAHRRREGRSDHPFDPRRYALFALVLAALEQAGEQTTLARLAEAVELHARDLDGFDLDFDRLADRRAFTHAVQAAADLGVLDLRDGDEERFARKEEGGDALYQVRHRRLAQVLAAPRPPSSVAVPAEIVQEAYPDTSEGRALRNRHRVMRMLVEEAVCYFDQLGTDAHEYVTKQRPRIFRQLERMCGFEMELRAEGVAALDLEGDSSDLAFPAEGTVAHAALLLAEEMVRQRRAGETSLTLGEIEAHVGVLVQTHTYWRADLISDAAGHRELAQLALDYLEAFRLIERIEGGVRPLPAIARVSPALPAAAPEASP